MYWQEERDQSEFTVPDDIVDLAFGIRCLSLPVDHAQSLFDEVRRVLPWFEEEAQAGLHTIHGAESGNGWERPEGEGSAVYLSQRTKLVLRLPNHRVHAARALEGQHLRIGDHPLQVQRATPRLLAIATTVYARYATFGDGDESEELFMQRAVAELRGRGFKFKKILCGKAHRIATAGGPVLTRSLMVAEMPVEEAVRLQQEGVGIMRKLGCGLFIPHKAV